MSDFLNGIVTLVGLLLGFAGVALTFITFFAPEVIQWLALKNPKSWVTVPSRGVENKTYRHRIYSGFTMEVDLSEPVSDGDFLEPWMLALHRPDPSATSYYVTLFFNGLPMDRMLFLQYDGSRNFIPVPLMTRVGDKLYASFTTKQRQFADIVGYDYFERSFEEVAAEITKSRHNPHFLSFPDTDLKERLTRLQDGIDTMKSRISKTKN